MISFFSTLLIEFIYKLFSCFGTLLIEFIYKHFSCRSQKNKQESIEALQKEVTPLISKSLSNQLWIPYTYYGQTKFIAS